jgi:hypothetical protein
MSNQLITTNSTKRKHFENVNTKKIEILNEGHEKILDIRKKNLEV